MNNMQNDTQNQLNKEPQPADLPLLLTVADIQRILGLSKTTVGYLVHQKDFPLVQLSPRKYIIPRDRFLHCLLYTSRCV